VSTQSEPWCMERRTTFVKHVAKGSTTRNDISLDDEGKAVPACHPNPVVLARGGRHDRRVSDVIFGVTVSPEVAEEIHHSQSLAWAVIARLVRWLFLRYVLSNWPWPISISTLA